MKKVYVAGEGMKTGEKALYVAVVALFLSTVFFAWLSWRNAKPLQCNDIVQLPNDATGQNDLVCEINLNNGGVK